MQKMSKKTKSVSFKEMMKHGINPLFKYTGGDEKDEDVKKRKAKKKDE